MSCWCKRISTLDRNVSENHLIHLRGFYSIELGQAFCFCCDLKGGFFSMTCPLVFLKKDERGILHHLSHSIVFRQPRCRQTQRLQMTTLDDSYKMKDLLHSISWITFVAAFLFYFQKWYEMIWNQTNNKNAIYSFSGIVRFLLVLQKTKTIKWVKIINTSQQHSIINKSCVNKPNKQSVFALIKNLLRRNVLGDIFQKNPSLWILLCNVPPLIILLIALCIAWCFFGSTEFLEDKWIASSLNERITHVCSLKNGTVPKKMRRHIHTLL